MIKIKRTAAILLAVGLTLSSVTGCSVGEGDSSETGVTIYTDATDEDETTRETNCIECANGYYKTEDSNTL